MADVTLIKYLFREDWAPLKEVLNAAGTEYGEIQDILDDKQLLKLMTEKQPAMVVASVKSKEDIAKVLGFLKLNKKALRELSVKFSAVNYTANRQVETALMKGGCQEVLDPGIKGKPLKYKLDMWKKTLVNQKQQVAGDSKLSIKEKGAEQGGAVQSTNEVKWDEPIKCVDDMWLIKKPADDAKKILGKWLVRFMGPSPFVGQWTEAVPGKRGIWKFVFKEAARETFHKTPGHWFFLGDQKPDFIWKENVWMVTGSQYQLVFQNGDEKEVRFQAVQAGLSVAKNSTQAKALEAAIVETFDQEVMVKKGFVAEGSTEVENDNKIAGHLKGKTEGEEPIDGGPLEGKGSTDDLGGNLEGDVKDGAEDQGGNYEGKGQTDGLDGEESGDAGSENVGPDKYKGKMKFDKTSRQSHYGGDTETDDLGPDHYSNQAGVGHEKEAKDKSHSLKKDPVRKGEMGGEIETEDLGPSHYSNGQNGGVQHQKDKANKLKKDALPTGEMNGDIETEDLGPAHYSNKNAAKPGDAIPSVEEAQEAVAKAQAALAAVEQAPVEEDNRSMAAIRAEEKAAKKKALEEAYQKAAEAESARERQRHAEENARREERREKAKKEVAEIEKKAAEEKVQKEKQQAETVAQRKKEREQLEASAEEGSNVVPIMRDKAKRPERPEGAAAAGAEEELPGGDYADNVVTSNATVVALAKKKGDEQAAIACRVDDSFDGQVILCVPHQKFALEDMVEVSMTFEYMKKIKKIEISGKCAEANPDGEGGAYVTLVLGEYEAKLFDQFMQLYTLRQKHVEEFMKQAKGL